MQEEVRFAQHGQQRMMAGASMFARVMPHPELPKQVADGAIDGKPLQAQQSMQRTITALWTSESAAASLET